ncbi:metallophosphoesterase [Rhizobiales bacterium RZME27]|uniref:Metallophosphoesterase n=1 Tax=Endobacterium cereale TaxID=2663029 RepID=A0A6A8AJJ7_9HYPH|nr:metallophosphoesterase [Endobacterium cereale]MEB2845771.1 metallophosphoesterase [Endobacterium cereale]MQY50057.1 metallophosphoesterase [Endobacterium cereale]
MLTRRTLIKGALTATASLLALAAYPFVEVMARPRITRHTLTPNGWTPGLKLRIVALADIHACNPWMTVDRIRQICATANGLGGDVILLLGDCVTATDLVTDPIAPSQWASALATLKAPLGVHAILGNHDYWHDDAFQLDPDGPNLAHEALKNAGIATYVNQATRLEKDGNPFWLAGLGDQMALPGRRFGGLDDLPETSRQITDTASAILMAHEPDIFARMDEASESMSLVLSGHTHGGQINIFGWRPMAASAGSRRYPAGHYREFGRDLIVSRGLGCSVLPVRIGSRPEINVIELG